MSDFAIRKGETYLDWQARLKARAGLDRQKQTESEQQRSDPYPENLESFAKNFDTFFKRSSH
jgi:hypothetical protein